MIWEQRYLNKISHKMKCNQMPIQDGDTIDGLRNGQWVPEIQWVCRYEDSLVQPFRPVLDICLGELLVTQTYHFKIYWNSNLEQNLRACNSWVLFLSIFRHF